MQTSSIRTSAIALCALAGLTTACEQNNLISQPDTLPDSDPGTSTASAREEMSARDRAASALATTQLASQGNRPETLKPESTRIKTSLGTMPTLNSRRYRPLPEMGSILPRLNLTPTIVPRSTWPSYASTSTAMSPLPTATSQPNLMAAVPGQPDGTQPATADLPGSSETLATPTSPASDQPSTSQPSSALELSDVQGHWSQPIVTALLNAKIVQGFSDGSFRPNEPITQEQFVGMVQRAFPEEAINADSIRLRPNMTRAEAAKVVYEALAEQGRIAPLATLVATQSQPLNSGQMGQPNAPVAPSSAASAQTAALAGAEPAEPTAQPTVQPTAVEAGNASAKADGEGGNLPGSETIARPMLQAAILAAEAVPSAIAAAAVPAAAVPAAAVPAAAVPATAGQSLNPGVSVAVMGEVSRPGGYSLMGADSKPTLIQAIQMAGGLTPMANIRQIQVRRAGATLTFDLWQVLQTGSLSKDLALQAGDTIAIPRATNLATAAGSQSPSEVPERIQVSVVGEVNNPGVLKLPPNALANQAIMASGGFNRQAQKADLIRLNSNGTIVRRTIAVDVAQGMNDLDNPRLQNNDVILVQRSEGMAIAEQWTALNPLIRILPIAKTL